jgi:hypothetical protein
MNPVAPALLGAEQTRPRTRSPVPLTLVEKELDDVDVQPGRLGQSHAVERWGIGRWLADAQRESLRNRNDLRDRRLSIQHRDRLPAANGTEVLAQPGFQFRNSHVLHGYIMTIIGHVCKRGLTLQGEMVVLAKSRECDCNRLHVAQCCSGRPCLQRLVGDMTQLHLFVSSRISGRR